MIYGDLNKYIVSSKNGKYYIGNIEVLKIGNVIYMPTGKF
jgi:hypothetical protein